MTTDAKLRQGTTAWFEMVGRLMIEAASRSRLPPELNLSLVERYTDGVELSEGLVQGIRFDAIRQQASESAARPIARIGCCVSPQPNFARPRNNSAQARRLPS
jgi:hypothetical protein